MILCWQSLMNNYQVYSRNFTSSVKVFSDITRCSFLVTGAILFPMQTPIQAEACHAVMLCHVTMEDKGHSAAGRKKLKL